MGVEVEESRVPVVFEEAAAPVSDESNLLKENGKAEEEEVVENNEPITFGSHGDDEPVKEDVVKPSAEVSNFPKDAVDEWPAAQQIYPHFVPKYRQFEDPKIKAKLEQADLELTKKNQARSQLIENLKKLRGDRAQKISLLKALNEENKQYRSLLDEKKKVRDPLQQALGTLGGRGSYGLCSSEKELNSLLKSMQYRIEHETNTLNEEKQIMKEIKQLEATRPQVVANEAQRAKILESMGEKVELQTQMNLLKVDMDGVRKDQQTVFAKRKQLEEEKDAIEKQVKAVEEELDTLTEKKDKVYQSIVELRKQRDEGNSAYYQNRSLLNEIRVLANKKDIAAVKAKVDTELENWISQWNNNKSFREDYVKRLPSSLDSRQFTLDGRTREFNEKPILAVEKVTPPETEAVSRTLPKQAPPPKDDVAAPTPAAAVVEKEEKSGKLQKETNKANKASAAAKAVEEADDEPDFYVPEKKQNDPPKVNEVDEQKLKEMKREQEIAKAKQALEKKKRQAEKAAAKAAIWAQKEAEKKQKALEKKEKKKAGVSADEPKETEAAAAEEVAESDKSATEETVETTVASSKNKNKKANNNPMKRRVRPRASESLPKTLLKRKKATNYWMWAAPAGVAITVMLAAVGYYFLN